MRGFTKITGFALVLCCVLSGSGYAQHEDPAQNPKRLARLKTAFIYNFTRNVYWPNEDQMKQFSIGVMSSKPLADQLAELEELVKFRNRLPIKVKYCKTVEEAAACNMVVVDGSGPENLWSLYSKIRGRGVLMVAENLADYKKSMISFVVKDGKMNYIINKTKLEESNLVVKEDLYRNAITREGDWNSIFEKFNYILKNGDKDVKVDKSDLAEMMSEFRTLEAEKQGKDMTIAQMQDSMSIAMAELEARKKELSSVGSEIEQQKKLLNDLGLRMEEQKGQLLLRETEIGKQRTVIFLIAGLTFGVLILLLLALRVNNQRRKANRLLSEQKREIEQQKQLVEAKQKEILDSINYAKRIQTALMANDNLMKNHLPEHFIFFKPKDIVAGDFYWAEPVNGSFVYATADSTGHGVPGAFMSLLNISKLNEAVNQKRITRPDLVLNDVKRGIIEALNPEGSKEVSRDGMDVVLCKINMQEMTLQYAAANNSFCIVRNGNILDCKGDSMPIGKSHDDHIPFSYNELKLEKGDMIYTFTDGFMDQFGGPKGKKLKTRKLKEMLQELATHPVDHQKKELGNRFDEWRGHLEQVDDVLLIGVRIT
jgi:serine phosphatase RsbU (regulator of sigma subunit)